MLSPPLCLWRIHPEPTLRVDLKPPFRVGRAPDTDLRLPEDDVSRVHATFESRDEGLCVVDQGSRNGVYLQGRRVGVSPIRRGSILRIGQSLLIVDGPSRFADELTGVITSEASRSSALLIVGEAGVGKRTIARAIHRRSQRAGSMITTEGTVDAGVWTAARGGSVLCEEPDDFDASSQEAREHNVRLLGVTSTDIACASSKLLVPPVRERLNELPDALGAFFERAKTSCTWDTDFLEALACHPFPLNFRELQVLCKQLVANSSPLSIEHLPHAVRAQLVEARSASATDLSRDRLHDALTRHRGNVRRVGQELGIGRGQLYRLLAALGLNPDLYRQAASKTPETAVREERRTLQ